MDIDPEEKERNIIPRWRDFPTTLKLGELISSGTSVNFLRLASEGSIEDQLHDWESHHSLSFATDLVGSAFVLGIADSIEEAAEFIISGTEKATPLQRRIAFQSLNREFESEVAIDDSNLDSKQLIDHSRQKVRKYRAELRSSLRNPIKLVELSREFATLGSIDKALKAMDMAVVLGSANRFVVRSAARLYVHAGQLEKAHRVVRNAPSLRQDPWILATEIAISNMRSLTSRNISKGFHLVDDTNFSPFELSELQGVLATIEMKNASGRRARQLFRQSLREPTDNSVAQVEWASRIMSNFEVVIPQAEVPRNYEAPAWKFYADGNTNDALNLGKNWILDQPFAVSPVVFTGMVANVTEDFELAQRLFTFGLSANPENATLRNNLAYALASAGDAILAEVELERIDRASLTIQQQIVVTATEGLILFRKGNLENGRRFYEKAIELARSSNEASYAMRGLMFLAREEIYAKTMFARRAIAKAKKESKKFRPNREMITVFERLDKLIRENPDAYPDLGDIETK